jgi:hypothetical protein
MCIQVKLHFFRPRGKLLQPARRTATLQRKFGPSVNNWFYPCVNVLCCLVLVYPCSLLSSSLLIIKPLLDYTPLFFFCLSSSSLSWIINYHHHHPPLPQPYLLNKNKKLKLKLKKVLFDNANSRNVFGVSGGPEAMGASSSSWSGATARSRGVEYELNWNTHEASVVWEVSHSLTHWLVLQLWKQWGFIYTRNVTHVTLSSHVPNG